jgi:hypothetical protein
VAADFARGGDWVGKRLYTYFYGNSRVKVPKSFTERSQLKRNEKGKRIRCKFQSLSGAARLAVATVLNSIQNG